MGRCRIGPLTACTIAAAAALGSAAVPGLARADEGVVDPLASLTTPAADTQAMLDDALAGAAEETSPTEASDVLPEADEAAEAEQAVEPLPEAIVPETPVSEAAPELVVAPVAAELEATSGNTTALEGDIAADTPHAAAPVEPVEPTAPTEHETAATEPPPAPSEPPAPRQANVNVSVRIGSPGDDGAVTQVNVLSTPTTTQPRSGATREPARDEPGRETPTAETTGTWYWSWDCLGIGSLGAISPFGSVSGSIPTSWTWVWNCGDKSPQYQGESSDGYRQINTSVAIRIASPGNDGSVSQVNVAVGRLTSPAAALPRVAASTPTPPSWPPSLPALPLELDEVLAATVSEPSPVLVGGIALPISVSAPTAAVPGETLMEIPVVQQPFTGERQGVGALLPLGAGVRASSPAAPAVDDRALLLGPTAVAPERTSVEADELSTKRATGVVSRPQAEPLKTRSAPRWRRAPLRQSVPAPVSPASAAAAGGASSSGSGLPFLLALPFVAALLDLVRRVALEHATWPSGHRRRAPDRPG